MSGHLSPPRNAAIPPRPGGSPTNDNKSRKKVAVAGSPLPSRRPKKGQKCYINPAFSESRTKTEQN